MLFFLRSRTIFDTHDGSGAGDALEALAVKLLLRRLAEEQEELEAQLSELEPPSEEGQEELEAEEALPSEEVTEYTSEPVIDPQLLTLLEQWESRLEGLANAERERLQAIDVQNRLIVMLAALDVI